MLGTAHELTPENRPVGRRPAQTEGPHLVVIARRAVPVIACDDDVVAPVAVDVGDGRNRTVAETGDAPRIPGNQTSVAMIDEQVTAAGAVAHDRDDLGQTIAVDVADDGRRVTERRIGGERARPARQHAAIALDHVQVAIGLHDYLGDTVTVQIRQRGRRGVKPRAL